MKKSLLGLICLLGLSAAKAQHAPCAFDERHNYMLQHDADYRKAVELNEAEIQRIMAERNKLGHQKAEPGVVTIPIVFHVIHKGEPVGTGTNISDAQLQSAIDGMNIQYRNKYADGTIFDAAGVDVKMEFCLAQKDPNGQPTTGINRVDGRSVANYDTKGIVDGGGAGAAGVPANETAVKALSRWDNRKYYNVWVVAAINGENPTGGGTQGYAYFPGANATVDGTVVLYNATGYCPSGSCPGFNLKAFARDNGTMVHEIGHAFSLYHTFQGADPNGASCPPAETNCNTQGDRVCDTDPHRSNLGTCKAVGSANDCTGGTYNAGLARNYMNYTNCTPLIFTTGQRDRMQSTMVSGAGRNSLTTSDGCDPVFPYDIALISLSQPKGFYCNPNVAGEVTIKNTGQNVISSFDVNILIDGAVANTYTWNGSIANNQTQVITIPALPVSPGVHTYRLEVIPGSLNNNNQFDGLASNNAVSTTFEIIGDGVVMKVDATNYANGDKVTVFRTGTTTVVATVTLPDNNGPFTTDLCLPKGCYDFEFTDVNYQPLNFPGGERMVPDITIKDDRGFTVANGIIKKNATAGNEIGIPRVEKVTNICVPYNPGFLDVDFVADKFVVVEGTSIQFTDLSTVSAGAPAGTAGANSWAWNFGDGGNASVKNPIYQFNTAGVYTVELTANNGIAPITASKKHYIRVIPALTGCDKMDNLITGEAPNFLSQVNGAPGYFPGPNAAAPLVYAEQFLAPSASLLQSIELYAARILPMTANPEAQVTVYGNSAGKPGAVLYTFNVPFSSLVEGNYQKIDLPTPVAVTDFFYVGVTMNTTQGDTLVLGAAPYRGANDFSNTSFALVNSVWTPVTSAFTGSSATSLAIRATLAFIPKAKFDSDVVQTCVGKTINYDATQTTNANNIEWTFEGGNPTTSTATKPVVTYNTQGPKTVRLVAFGGCANSDTLIKTINIAPPPSLEIEVIDEVCMGKNGEAKALPAGGSGSYTFNWNTTPAQTSSIATGLSAGSYICTMTDLKCGTVTKSASIANLTKLPDFTVDQTNTTCGQNNGTAKANPVGGTGTYTYQWTKTGDAAFSQTGRTAVNLSPGTYTVEVRDGSCNPNSKTITILSSAGVTGDVQMSSTSACQGQTVTLTANGGTNYVWNDGISDIAFVESITVTPSSTTDYSVRIANNEGCAITLSRRIVVTQSPTAIARSSNSNGSAYTDNSTVDIREGGFAFFSSSGSLGNTYTWFFGDGDSSDVKNPFHQYTAPGLYEVVLRVKIGDCESYDTTYVAVVNSVGINEVSAKTFAIYPNPSSGLFTIDNKGNDKITAIEVFDLVGKSVLRIKQFSGSTLDLSDMPSGSYTLQIQTEQSTQSLVLKVIK